MVARHIDNSGRIVTTVHLKVSYRNWARRNGLSLSLLLEKAIYDEYLKLKEEAKGLGNIYGG